MKKFEWSKIVVLFVGLVFTVLIGFSCFMIYKTLDLSPLAYIIPTAGGVCATAVGFYFNKAKAENVVKISKAVKEQKLDTKTLQAVNAIVSGGEVNVSDIVDAVSTVGTEIINDNIEVIEEEG